MNRIFDHSFIFIYLSFIVKFEGSLGKLSITSVHHPRQIMDLSTPEIEKVRIIINLTSFNLESYI